MWGVFGSPVTEGFNPRSYTRSDATGDKIPTNSPVSIHAPTRGATVVTISIDQETEVSIHAPTRGATKK